MNLFLGANYSLRTNRTTSRSRGLAVASFSSDIHVLICASFQGERARVIQANTTTEMAADDQHDPGGLHPRRNAGCWAYPPVEGAVGPGYQQPRQRRDAEQVADEAGYCQVERLQQWTELQQLEHNDREQGQQHDHGLLPVGRHLARSIAKRKPTRKGRGDLESVHLHGHGEPASCARPTRGRSDCGPRRPEPYLPS
jgi:hypothetical protein